MNFRLVLLPFSFIYSGLARLRNLLYNTGVFKQHRFDIPVILVGNLSVGGTGKTPHVEYLVELLRRDYRVATLSRGYGRKSGGFVLAGKGASSEIIGDEPMQYYSKFEDVTVAVCEKRVEGIEKLLASDKKPQVIIMDDGFQHRQVDPGFKILLTSFDRLFTGDYVLPAGDLREPRAGYRRADFLVVTRCDKNLAQTEKDRIVKQLHPYPHQQVFFSSLVYDNPAHFFSWQTISLEEMAGKPVFLFSGIANAASLEAFVKSNSSALETVRFGDHHNYSSRDIMLLKEKFDKFAGSAGIMLTTEKDYQRMRNTEIIKDLEQLPCYFIPIKVQICKEASFNQIVRSYVEANKGNS